ncbi:hypothetical protein LBMAG48_10600 [Phycisphaerae bacterium]|nr:hypothetical protein LBMAG48_10600 [Phycisphaerae bacterium]
MCTTPKESKGELVAIKVFDCWTKPERHQAFLEEIAFLQACPFHPAILRVFDKGSYKGYSTNNQNAPFVVMEYLPQTLRGAMREGRLSLVTKVSYAIQLLSALVFLDSRNPKAVHRDIKPENILIKGGACVLGNFGLLKRISDLGARDLNDMESLKASLGHGMPARYRTPDLVDYLNGGPMPTPKSDVFQLGLVLTELFTGRNPHKAYSDIRNPVELEPLRQIPGSHGGSVEALLRRMLEMDISKRDDAGKIIDGWEGVFRDVVDSAMALEGRAF